MRALILGLVAFAAFGQISIIRTFKRPATPTDSPGAGTYSSTQSVTFASINSDRVYYTNDGSTPTCTGTGTLYSGAISTASTTTYRAIGCSASGNPSAVLTSAYTINSGISVIQTCMQTIYDTSASCAAGTNLTSGDVMWVFGVGTNLSSTLGTSGAGCPSSSSTVTSGTGYRWWTGTASAGACTLSISADSGTMMLAFWVTRGGSGTADGTGNTVLNTTCSGTPCSGATYSTAHDGDIVLGFAVAGSADASLSARTPWSSDSPYQVNTSHNGYCELLVGQSQGTHGTATITWNTSLEWTAWYSTVLGVY